MGDGTRKLVDSSLSLRWLREPVTFGPVVLAKVAGKVWKTDPGEPSTAEGADGFVVGVEITEHRHVNGRLFLNADNHTTPYTEDVEEAAERRITDLRLRSLPTPNIPQRLVLPRCDGCGHYETPTRRRAAKSCTNCWDHCLPRLIIANCLLKSISQFDTNLRDRRGHGNGAPGPKIPHAVTRSWYAVAGHQSSRGQSADARTNGDETPRELAPSTPSMLAKQTTEQFFPAQRRPVTDGGNEKFIAVFRHRHVEGEPSMANSATARSTQDDRQSSAPRCLLPVAEGFDLIGAT